MSLGASQHICASCLRSLSRDARRRLLIVRSLQHRELSYSRLERQGAGQTTSVGCGRSATTLFNTSTGIPYDRGGSTQAQDIRIGRYSRAPLDPSHLLQELAPSEDGIDATGHHVKRVEDVSKTPTRSQQATRLHESNSNAEATHSRRSLQVDRPVHRPNPVLQDIRQFQQLMQRHKHDEAWELLKSMASRYKANQLRVVRQSLEFERQLASVIDSKITTWFGSTRGASSDSQSIAGTKQNASNQTDNAQITPDGVATADVQAGKPFRPFDVCRVLGTLGILTPGLIAFVLCKTLYGVLESAHAANISIDTSKSKHALQDVLAIWYRALVSQLEPDRDASFATQHGDAVTAFDWGFLPGNEALEGLGTTLHHSLRPTVELFLPVASRSIGRTDFTSAVVLTVYLLRQPQLTNDMKSGLDDYRPLLLFWSKVMDAVATSEAPDFIRSIFMHKDSRDVHDQLALFLRQHHITLPEVKVESRIATGETIQVDQPSARASNNTSAVQATTTVGTDVTQARPDSRSNQESLRRKSFGKSEFFADQCGTRIGRAIEYHDAAQADKIFAEVLAHEQDNQGTPRLPLALFESLVDMFMKMRKPWRAEQVAQVMPKVGWSPSIRTYTSLIRGSARTGDLKSLDRYWSLMLVTGTTPDPIAYGAKVHALVELRRPDKALEAMQELGQMWLQSQKDAGPLSAATRMSKSSTTPLSFQRPVATSLQPTVGVGNAMLSALVGKRDDDYAKYIPAVLKWMSQFDLQPDINTYNPLIDNAMRNGKTPEAMALLKQMKERGVAPNAETGRGLIAGYVNSDVLDRLNPEEQAQHVLDVLDDIETNHIGSSLDNRAYTILIERILDKHSNRVVVEKLLDRMQANGIRLTAHIYTILFDHYMKAHPPDYAAVETLWNSIKSANRGWGAQLDDYFFDRALERFSEHHQVLGISKIVEILDHLPTIGKQASYISLLAVAQVYVQRQEIDRLRKLVNSLRTMSTLQAKTRGRYGYGHREFWEFIIQSGVLSREGITSYAQLKDVDQEHIRSRKGKNWRL